MCVDGPACILPTEAVIVSQAFLYDADGKDREVRLDEVDVRALESHNLLWIDLDGEDASEVKRIAASLGVEPDAVSVAGNEEPPSLENYREYFRIVVDAAPSHLADDVGEDSRPAAIIEGGNGERSGAGSVRIEFFVSRSWLLTIHNGAAPCLTRFRQQDKAETMIGRLTGQALAAALLDWHLDEYFQEVSRIEATADGLDERVLREAATRSLLGRMVALRRRVSKLRTLLVAQRGIFYGLSRPDFVLVTDSGAAPFYEALVGRFERALDEVERARDVVVGSFELFTSRTGQQTNDLVKFLTFLTAVVGFCAAVAGLLGMNFKLSIFDTGYAGFAVVTGSLLLVALMAVAVARHRDWI